MNIHHHKIAIAENKIEATIKDWAETSFRCESIGNGYRASWTLEQHTAFYTAEFEAAVKTIAAEAATPKKPTYSRRSDWRDTNSIFGVSSDGGY
jgi:hypothetical protein